MTRSTTASNALTAAKLLVEAELESPLVIDLPNGRVAVVSRAHPFRQPNQDTAAVIPAGAEGAVLAVADGVGGASRGAEAAAIAVQMLADGVSGREPEGRLRTAILDAIEDANQHLVSGLADAGTTLAVVEINGRCVRPYHIGDSAILVFGRGGKLKLHTVAHTPVGFAMEAGLLEPDEAMHHKDRHLLLNLVGSEEMRIVLGAPICLARHDTLLLASDGLIDNLGMKEIIRIARKGSIGRAAAKLAALAWQRMVADKPDGPSKPDDLTVLLYRRTK